MRKVMFILAALVVVSLYAQSPNPKIEQIGDLVKATYYYDNGNVRQQGFVKDGKLHGEWISYREDGTKVAIAQYNKGQKVGKWLFYDAEGNVKEVDYSSNNIVNVIEVNTGSSVVEN